MSIFFPRVLAVLFYCSLLVAAAFSQVPDSVTAQGHLSPVVALEYSPEHQVFLSAGADGFLKVWEADGQKNVATHRPVTGALLKLALHPIRKEAALIAKTREGRMLLIGLNWQTGEILFRKDLEGEPYAFAYSGQGRYILLGQLSAPHTVIMTSGDGQAVSLFPGLRDQLFSYLYLGASEKILMTYHSSGKLEFWDQTSPDPLLSVPTEPGLTDISISLDKKTMLGVRQTSVLLIDRANGRTLSSLSFPSPVKPIADPVTPQWWAYYQGTDDRPALLKVEATAENQLMPAEILPLPAMRSLFSAGFLAGGTENGELLLWDGESWRPFAENHLVQIRQILASKDEDFVLTERYLVEIPGGLASWMTEGRASPAVVTPLADLPLPKGFAGEEGIYLWSARNSRETRVFFKKTGEQEFKPIWKADSGIRSLKRVGGEFFLVETSGALKIYRPGMDQQIWEINPIGVQSADQLAEGSIIAAVSGNSLGSLMKIDRKTKETVPWSSPNFANFDLGKWPLADAHLALGWSSDPTQEPQRTWTQLVRVEKSGETRVLWRAEGDSAAGSLGIDGDRGVFTFGEGIWRISEAEAQWLQSPGIDPVDCLVTAAGYLTMDSDLGLSLWSREGHLAPYRVFFSKDGTPQILPASF